MIHGGIATGFKSGDGKLGTPLAPEGPFTGNRTFKMDIPLQPGDSGGPVVDAYGRLVGINSAVEFLVPMETAFFVDSEGNRPNIRTIDATMAQDRSRNSGAKPAVIDHCDALLPEIILDPWHRRRRQCSGSSCTPVGDSWMSGSMAAAAKDQIMLVRKDPPSFGYQRLEYQSRVYPDLAIFRLQTRPAGLPRGDR